jgi:hypothetical protein
MHYITSLDAVVYNDDSKFYWFFKGELCWKKKYGKGKPIQGPYEISKCFKNAPNDLDAVIYNSYSKQYWFFKGKLSWKKKFGKNNPVRGEYPISKHFINVPDNLDAATYNSKSERYWFFKNGKFYSQDYSKNYGRKKVESKVDSYENSESKFGENSFDLITSICFNSDSECYWLFYKNGDVFKKEYGRGKKFKKVISETVFPMEAIYID